MRYFFIKLIGVAVASSFALSGCGGSLGGTLGQASTAEGLFVGNTSTNRTTVKFVVNTGAYYIFYSAVNNPEMIAGAVQGTSLQSNGTFTSSDAIDVNLEGLGVLPAAVAGSYVTAQSFTATVTYASANQAFTLADTYSPTGYQAAPNLATLAGTYSGKGGTSATGETHTMSISATGAVSGFGTGGCNYSGTVLPLAKGNGYAISIGFGAAPCAFPNVIISGLAYLDSANKRLYATGLLPDRTDGFVFSGTK
jgi:hypothetical protein